MMSQAQKVKKNQVLSMGTKGPRLLVLALSMAALCFSTISPSGAGAVAAPADFFGVSGFGQFGGEVEQEEIRRLGIHTVRLNFVWKNIQTESCEVNPKLSGENIKFYDDVIRRAANRNITPLAVLYGSRSACDVHPFPRPGTTMFNDYVKKEGFVWQIVQRYGVNGKFWQENPGVPPHPIRNWEVWNEPNLSENNPEWTANKINAQRYAEFLIATSKTIREAQESQSQQSVAATGTNVLMGSMVTVLGAKDPGTYFEWIYDKPSYSISAFKNSFDGLAFHPYAIGGKPSDVFARIAAARTLLNNYQLSGKGLWITEFGWPVGIFKGDLGTDEVTEGEQNEYLSTTFNWLYNNADSYQIKQAVLFVYQDRSNPNECSGIEDWDCWAGLKDVSGKDRPSWCTFEVAVTGACPAPGDAHPVSMRNSVTNQYWVYYRAADGYIYELYRDPNTGVSFNNKVPAVQPAATGTSPVIGRNATSNAQWIYYRGADGYIWELFRNPSTGAWSNTKVPNAQGVAAGSSPVIMGDPSAGAAWIYYRAADGYIWELYRDPNTGVWFNNKVPAVQPAAMGTNPVIGRNATSNAQWIYYRGADDYIWELFRNPSTGAWSNTKVPNAQAAAPGSSPVIMGDPSAGAAWIYYRAADGYIWELWRNPSTGIWANNKVPAVQPAATETTPVIGRNATSNAQWIYYRGADGYIWELFRNPSTGAWSNTKVPNAQGVAAGSSLMLQGDPSTGEAWIDYRGSDNYIWQLWRNPSTGIWANGKFPSLQM